MHNIFLSDDKERVELTWTLCKLFALLPDDSNTLSDFFSLVKEANK